ncbi:hypothetical protein Fcan01_09352 [Folsomia candida]|uniref:Uncharacterized protein n=1 Tax=Folsomia candida TaxID=158441 RepID=A0A226EG65_FOLCA|nr:hypothetical protein Fcan01_09352 [Folsomia candida]
MTELRKNYDDEDRCHISLLRKSNNNHTLVIVLFAVYITSPVVTFGESVLRGGKVHCPGLSLESRWGVHVDCILTTRGVQTFDCSNPVPPETVALYSCQRYFRQISASSPVKLRFENVCSTILL